MSKEID